MGDKVVPPERLEQAQALMEDVAKAQKRPDESPPESKEGEPSEKRDEGDDEFDRLLKSVQEGAKGMHDPEVTLTVQFFDSKERRLRIESRCKDLSFDEYVLRGEFRQEVPIWGEGRPTVELRSIRGSEHMVIRDLITSKFSAPLVAEAAQNFLIAACGTVRIGDRSLPDMPAKGAAEEEIKDRILKRLAWVLGEPFEISWDLYINHLWFQSRIRRAQYGKDAPF
jgi:hypothetical protein